MLKVSLLPNLLVFGLLLLGLNAISAEGKHLKLSVKLKNFQTHLMMWGLIIWDVGLTY